MIKRSTLNLSITILGILLALNFVTAHPVYAGITDAKFYVEPSEIFFDRSTTSVGNKFNITVWWKDTGTPLNGVFAWQILLTYNSTLLNCTRAWQPMWDAEYIFHGMAPLGVPPTLERVGEALVMDTLLGVTTASSALSKLAIFEFEILLVPAEGQSFSSILGIDNADTIWSLDAEVWYDPIRENGAYIIPEFPHIALIIAFLALCSLPMILRKTKKAAIRTGTPTAN